MAPPAIAALGPAQLMHAQGKLTYVGLQSEVIPTVLFSSYGAAPRIELFRAFRTSGINYANDDLEITPTFTVRPEEFKGFIDALGRLPRSLHALPAAANVSAMFMPDMRHPTVVEALLGRDGISTLIRDMKAVLGIRGAHAQWILDSFAPGP
jgi:hypothetical protein